MQPNRAVSGYQIARQSIALTLSVLLIPFASGNLYAQGGYAPLGPVALDQLVAPMALYPDPLVAQILTASTYPQQVSDADNWLHQTAGMPPAQRAEAANGMPWDPSVKALTAFPSVLDNMARNYNWTSSLGNAYYNQPGDVMNAVQAARWQAQQAGYLRSTPQQRVYESGGQILIAPVNPNLVYVPYYNPWRIYGRVGFALCGLLRRAAAPRDSRSDWASDSLAVGISVGLFAHYGWGFHSWAPNWRGGVVEYNHAAYYSRSPTVFNHGHFGGYNRGVFEHAGPGVPANFHAAPREGFARGPVGERPGFNRPGVQPCGTRRSPAGARTFSSRPLAHSPAAAARAQRRA